MGGHIERSELLRGGAAAAMFLLTVAIGLTPWLAVPLAAVTYLAVVLLWPGRDGSDEPDARRQRSAYQAAIANAEAIGELQAWIVDPSVRDQVDRIHDRAGQVLEVMREDDDLTAAPLFNDHLLTPTRTLLEEYVRLTKREIGGASDLLEKTETQYLPRIERSIDIFYERLHRSHVVDLATVGEVLELNLDRISTTSSRRLTS